MPGEEARRQPAMAAPIPKAAPMRTFATATIRHVSEIRHHGHHLRRGGDEDQPDGKVHEHRMKSTDKRHVTHTDRGGPHIFRGAWTRRGNNSRVSGSLEQTMPRQTFEEVVLSTSMRRLDYARWLTEDGLRSADRARRDVWDLDVDELRGNRDLS